MYREDDLGVVRGRGELVDGLAAVPGVVVLGRGGKGVGVAALAPGSSVRTVNLI